MKVTKYHMIHKFEDGKEILINTLDGSYIPIEHNLAEKILQTENDTEIALVPGEIKKMLECSVLVEQEEKGKIAKHIAESKREMQKKRNVYVIYLTYNCNLKCKYCCYDRFWSNSNNMDSLQLDQVSEQIKAKQDKTDEDCRICLFGGEILIRKNYNLLRNALEKLERLSKEEELKGRNCKLMLFTNGVEISYFKYLLARYSHIIEYVLVTLLGTKNMHNSLRMYRNGDGNFEQVVKGIQELLEQEIPTYAVTNINRENLQEITTNQQLIQKYGWDKNPFFQGYYFGRIKYYDDKEHNGVSESEFVREIRRQYKENAIDMTKYNFGDLKLLNRAKKFCDYIFGERDKPYHNCYGCESGCLKQYSFGPDGNIYTCSGAMGIEDYQIGTLADQVEKKRASWWTKRTVVSMEKCRTCNMMFLCGGGCAYAANEINGDPRIPYCCDVENVLHEYLDCIHEGIKIPCKDLLRD